MCRHFLCCELSLAVLFFPVCALDILCCTSMWIAGVDMCESAESPQRSFAFCVDPTGASPSENPIRAQIELMCAARRAVFPRRWRARRHRRSCHRWWRRRRRHCRSRCGKKHVIRSTQLYTLTVSTPTPSNRHHPMKVHTTHMH